MQLHLSNHLHAVVQHTRLVLQRAPVIRSAIYLGGAVALAQSVASLFDDAAESDSWRVDLLLGVTGTAWTHLFLRLEERPWNDDDLHLRASSLLRGAALGTVAAGSVYGIAMRRGWLDAPAWGWQRWPPTTLVRSMARLMVQHALVAWNEELVFRGYGYHTLRAALGTPAAEGILLALFALYHPWQPQVLLGQTATGAALLALRLSDGTLAMPLGYHWAWNVMQTAVLGPDGAIPTLRPVQVHGPYRWVGRPGTPAPGLLHAIVSGIVAVGVGLRWWWRTRPARD